MKQQSKTQTYIYKLIAAITLIVLVAGLTWYILGKTGVSGKRELELPTTVEKVDEKTNVYRIYVEYPSFGTGLEELNKKIKDDVTSRIDEFTQQATENWEIMKGDLTSGGTPPESPFSFSLTWTPKQINTNYVSFVMDVSWFPGGANMAQDYVTYNWDVKKNAPILLSDLFSAKSDYLDVISAYARDDLRKQFIKSGTEEKYIAEDILDSGTAPETENFSRFTFDDKTITFYFPKYQVAPGAWGAQTVVMSRSK